MSGLRISVLFSIRENPYENFTLLIDIKYCRRFVQIFFLLENKAVCFARLSIYLLPLCHGKKNVLDAVGCQTESKIAACGVRKHCTGDVKLR